MNDIYVYDRYLKLIGIVDTYKSLIWANRYNDVGDCELYIMANDTNIELLQKNFYLVRPDDNSMICQIKKIELNTDSESGDFLIITGYDVKRWLDQRIIWDIVNVDGNVEEFIRGIVDHSLITTSSERQITDPAGTPILYLGDPALFNTATTEQIAYKKIGEKVREYCVRYGWGYRITFSESKLYFELYQGADRSLEVVFSDEYDNLITTTYSEDETHMGNVALVVGEGEGSERARNVSGYAEGIDRYELFVDAKDISKKISWDDLIEIYPMVEQGGQGYITGDAETGYTYILHVLDIQILDTRQLTELEIKYPNGQKVIIDGTEYYEITEIPVASLPSDSPESLSTVELLEIIYMPYLLSRGYDVISEYGAVTSFEGSVEPDITFRYREDYNLGDIVTIQNRYGISVQARIIEAVEVNDDNGYSLQPKFEYITEV